MDDVVINVNRLIDFTLLDPRANFKDIEKLCDIAYKNQYYAVCVNPCFVRFAKNYIDENFNSELKVVCVVGFPLGACKSETKCFEAKQAILDGADEIDFVINIGMLKSGNLDYIKNEISKLKKVTKKIISKAIIETCYLDENEIIKISKICAKYKIDFIKTSTGFGIGGATASQVDLIRSVVCGKCKVKASGGIKDRAKAVELINHGAERIGTSHIL